MRTVTTIAAAVLAVIALTGSSFARHRHVDRTVTSQHNHMASVGLGHNHVMDWDDNTWLDLDGGSVIISHKERGEKRSTVEITEDHELLVDGDLVKLDADQKVLVGQFHDDCFALVDQAKEVGIEGAKVGLEGAKLGVQAVACVFKLMLPDYDSDDLEAEMDRESDKIEAKASVLEKKAEVIEDMVNDLEDQADELRDRIPELNDLYWF